MMAFVAERAFDDSSFPNTGRRAIASGSEKRKITRNRTSYSCQKCRFRKIKCDKQHPACGACVKNQEECVYGKLESEAPNGRNRAPGVAAPISKRRRSPIPTGLPSPPKSRTISTDAQNLEALELQLQRLSSMIDSMRRESGTTLYRVPGPSTSLSGGDDRHNGQLTHTSPDQHTYTLVDDQPHLAEPLSELNLNRKDGAGTDGYGIPFWGSLVEEVEQLQAMMQGVRPLHPRPHADASDVGCPGHSYHPAESNGSHRPKSHIDVISFRSLAKMDEFGSSNTSCETCFQNASDKSMLLPGRTATRLATLTKLDLLAGIPTEAQSNVLFRAWLTGVYPALPFMSIRHSFKKHQTFWDWKNSLGDSPLSSTTESADVMFMPILYSIWYSGTLSLSARGFKTWFPDKTRAQMAAHYHDQVIRYLSLVSFPSNLQAPLIACFVLLQSIPAAEEEPVQSSTFVNLMVRLAQTAGVHREPTLFGVASHEAEIRRRMWWQIVQLDSTFASASGYPTFVSDDTADTRPVSDVHEGLVGSSEEQKYLRDSRFKADKASVLPEPLSATESIVSAFQLVVRASHHVALAVRKAANMHMSTKLVDKEGLQTINRYINEAEAEVGDVIRRLPTKGVPELGFVPDATALSRWPSLECDSSFGSSLSEAEYALYFGLPDRPSMSGYLAQYHRQKLCAFNKWARISLSAMCDKMYCVAYAPFLKNAKSKVWTTGRQCALHHCTSFLRKFISLITDASLESYRWNWPGTLHPMHAAMILLVDVYERPHSVEAPRCRALIDKVFSIGDPANNIVAGEDGVSTQRPLREGGPEAWDLLRDLRISGWKKAGLDPSVLWTEKDQVLVGVAKPLTADQQMARSLREDLLEPEDEVSAFPQPQAVGTDPGFQHAMELARVEMVDGDLSAAQSTATTPGRHSRQLYKLSTQQAMPYPLHDFERRSCPGLDHHPEDDHKEAAEAEAARVLALKRQIEAYGPNERQRPVFDPTAQKPSGVSNSNPPSVHFSGFFNAFETNLGGNSNGATSSTRSTQATDVSSSNGTGQESVTDRSSDIQDDHMQTDSMSEGFDWERWDAVFGQYSGFTDLMEMDTDDWHH